MDALKKKRPWRDWQGTWQPQREQIMARLRKLGIDTSTWNTKKGQVEVICISDDSDGDQEGGGQGREPGDIGTRVTVDGTTDYRNQDELTRVKTEHDYQDKQGDASTMPSDPLHNISSSLRSVGLTPDSASNTSTGIQRPQPVSPDSGIARMTIDMISSAHPSARSTAGAESEVEVKPEIVSEYGGGQEREDDLADLDEGEEFSGVGVDIT
ncbi:uncharacterized protein L199_004988 [Kwoniella botswanensis]|uniref:uncharacterized protein n=1 Tax=Kwoniella botswanensis TaxID=1268659 RepID=UPI00315DDB68